MNGTVNLYVSCIFCFRELKSLFSMAMNEHLDLKSEEADTSCSVGQNMDVDQVVKFHLDIRAGMRRM